jgi:hypothetical protein
MVPSGESSHSCSPSQPMLPASVTTNAGTPSLAKIDPWNRPIAAPMSSTRIVARISGMPWRTDITASDAAATPATEATDRSISPSSRTRTTPTLMMPVEAICNVMLDRFCAVRNRLFSDWKTIQITIRPMMTGQAPSSPPRSRRVTALSPVASTSRGSRSGGVFGVWVAVLDWLTASPHPARRARRGRRVPPPRSPRGARRPPPPRRAPPGGGSRRCRTLR